MAVVTFPDPTANNPATGDTYGEGWYNPDNGVTYKYVNGVWKADSVQGGTVAGDLQQVTDNGNTTTNGATFGGIVDVGGNPQSAEVGCRLRADIGFSMACAPANGVAFGVYEEGDTQRNCSIYSDGRATFASIVSVNAEGKRGDNETILAGYDSSKSVTSTINGDGSATFADGGINLKPDNGGKLEVSDFVLESAFNHTIIKTDATGFWSPDSWSFGPDVSDTSSAVISLNATEGNIVLDGRLTCYGRTTAGARVTISNPGNVPCLSGYGSDGVEKFKINAQTGTGDFEGKITANNVTFNLEPDDDSNYVTTTDAEGNESRVYNGPTLDVKDLLETTRTALETLKSAAASASDFAGLKAAIATALANI